MKFLDFLNKIYLSPDRMISFVAKVSLSKENRAPESSSKDSRIIIDRDGSVRINKDNVEVMKTFDEISKKLASCK